MEAVWTGAAANVLSSLVSVPIALLTQLIDDVVHLDRNSQLQQDNLSRMRVLLQDISNQFQHDQRSLPDTINGWLQRIQHSLEDGKRIMERAQAQKPCLDFLLCKPRVSKQIREWNTNFDQLFIHLERDFSIFRNAQQSVSSAPLTAAAFLQPVPESGFVGSGIQSAEMQLKQWIDADDHQARVIGVYGMPGVGKTSLLEIIYNAYRVGNVFEVVIWITVSQNYNILDLQSKIAEAINLELGSSSNSAMRKMRIYAWLKTKKFLMILDDMWSPLHMEEEVGIPLVNDKGSRVVISTRSIDVIRRMGANDYSIPMEPLSSDEAWQLFYTVAFKAGGAPRKNIEDIARQMAGNCKGLPLALKVVAAAMTSITDVKEWDRALTHMKNVDPVFVTTYSGIQQDLYEPLKLSYDHLPDSNFKNCFLYCGAFVEDENIHVERLVEMWIAEGLVNSRGTNSLMDSGLRYVNFLAERCLFEKVGTDLVWIKVHDVLRDMAIHIAENEENCVFRTSQKLQKFPAERGIDHCKRIAVGYNNIPILPTDFTCPKLVTLILAQNESLNEVPNGFLLNLKSLRVLDLSRTKIESLPISVCHLRQLEFLRLSYTLIKDLPEEIGNLSQLQFLHLFCCGELTSLPCGMGRLQNLKHLNLDGCGKLAGIPREISQLTSLEKLELMTGVKGILRVEEANSSVCSLKDLTNLPYLMDLSVLVKPGFNTNGIRSGVKVGTMAAWLEMRHLTLKFDVKQHDVVMQDLPEDMQNMKKLQVLNLGFYHGISLPNCICDFEQLEKLNLYDCYQLAQLPPLERLPNLRILSLRMCTKLRELKIGTWASASGFPLLESLHLQDLPLLESMTTSSSNVFWNEEAMPVLQFLKISRCPLLKKLPNGLEKLPKLRQIDAEKDWWEALIWEDDNIKVCLLKLFKATTGSSWKDKLKRLSQTGKLKGTTS